MLMIHRRDFGTMRSIEELKGFTDDAAIAAGGPGDSVYAFQAYETYVEAFYAYFYGVGFVPKDPEDPDPSKMAWHGGNGLDTMEPAEPLHPDARLPPLLSGVCGVGGPGLVREQVDALAKRVRVSREARAKRPARQVPAGAGRGNGNHSTDEEDDDDAASARRSALDGLNDEASTVIENDDEAEEVALATGGSGRDWFYTYGRDCYGSAVPRGAASFLNELAEKVAGLGDDDKYDAQPLNDAPPDAQPDAEPAPTLPSVTGGMLGANRLQQLAIALNLDHLLELRAYETRQPRRYNGQSPLPNARPPSQLPTPLRLLIQGTAGTGKTNVVKAITRVACRLWRSPLACGNWAPTGAAATLLPSGSTIHSSGAGPKNLADKDRAVAQFVSYPMDKVRKQELKRRLAPLKVANFDERGARVSCSRDSATALTLCAAMQVCGRTTWWAGATTGLVKPQAALQPVTMTMRQCPTPLAPYRASTSSATWDNSTLSSARGCTSLPSRETGLQHSTVLHASNTHPAPTLDILICLCARDRFQRLSLFQRLRPPRRDNAPRTGGSRAPQPTVAHSHRARHPRGLAAVARPPGVTANRSVHAGVLFQV